MFVKTAVSELDFDTVKVGGNITVTSNETMESYSAVIKEVSEFPVDSATAGVYGNPNSSFYPIKAYIEDAGDLRIGEQVTVTYDSQSMGTAKEGAIYLPMAYVRTEGKQSYVYKADSENRLVRANIKTGRVIQGSVIEVTEGLTLDDKIAFPYGNNVKEGAKTKVSDNPDDIVW
jgi:hypothetical protein